MAFSAWSVIAGETPTATKWNILGSNDADFDTRLDILEAKPINRAYTFGITGSLAVGDEQGMKFIVPQNMTVVKIWFKIGSGTNAGVRIQKDTTNVDTFTATTSVGSTTSIDSAALTAGQILTLDITSVSGATDLFVTVECQQP